MTFSPKCQKKKKDNNGNLQKDAAWEVWGTKLREFVSDNKAKWNAEKLWILKKKSSKLVQSPPETWGTAAEDKWRENLAALGFS